MDVLDILLDALRAAVLITGMVVMMMMMIESLNIESRGRFFAKLQGSKIGQIIVSALLGAIPGCMGGFASVSLFSHGLISFGALVAMLIATSGDEAFVMFALFPGKALLITGIILAIGIAVGVLIDYVGPKLGLKPYALHTCDAMEIHDVDLSHEQHDPHHDKEVLSEEPAFAGHERHFSWQRVILIVGIILYVVALCTGILEHEHETETGHSDHAGFNLLSETWMNHLFATLSVVMLAVTVAASDHFVEDHLFKHVIEKHVPRIFFWTFGVLLVLGFGSELVDINSWVSANIPLMIVLATLIGIIPESGPHLIFVTLFATGAIPAPVLLASCISQDGHASLPLLAESKRAFVRAKLINCVIALIVGFVSLWLFH